MTQKTSVPALEELVNQSGLLTNPLLPGINPVKLQKITAYALGLIQAEGLSVDKVQLLIKDKGDDISITIYHDGAIHTQTNYSLIP